jgi:hypothetical protein
LEGSSRPDDRRTGTRLGAYPGSLQIEKPFAVPDTMYASSFTIKGGLIRVRLEKCEAVFR